MPVPTQNLSVIADGLAKLTSAYQNAPVTVGLLEAMLWSVQDIENVTWTVLNGVDLDPAVPPTGQNLTNIAEILNIQRNGLNDAQLWTLFKLTLLALRSRGRSEDILAMANAMNPTDIQEYPIASMLLESWNILAGVTDLPTFIMMLGRAKDGGARLTLNYSTWPDSGNSRNLRPYSIYGSPTGFPNLTSSYTSVSNIGYLVASTTVYGV